MKSSLKKSFSCLACIFFLVASPGLATANNKKPINRYSGATIEKSRLAADLHCYQSAKYFVIGKDLKERGGTDFLIKDKLHADEKPPCLYVFDNNDFEIKNEWAEYFAGLHGNLLLLDSTTGPGPSALTIWDLDKRRKVYQGTWSGPIEISDDSITYWTESGEATKDNCPDRAQWQELGLGAAIETQVVLSLTDFTISRSKESRCSPRQ